VGGKTILIDCGPDFRAQGLRIGLKDLDGVILTHAHYDHIAGIDDLRVFYFIQKKVLPCLLSDQTLNEIKIRYSYFFQNINDDVLGGSRFDFQVLHDEFGKTNFLGLEVDYMSYEQGGMKITGFKIGKLAYILDIKHYTEKLIHSLKGTEILVMSALRQKPSPAHLTIDEAIAFAGKVGAQKTYFSHVSHDEDFHTLTKILPPGIEIAYDGLTLLC
jgi:phosphoribosyl 1,2-cyclic phosphate phosphodiesterase